MSATRCSYKARSNTRTTYCFLWRRWLRVRWGRRGRDFFLLLGLFSCSLLRRLLARALFLHRHTKSLSNIVRKTIKSVHALPRSPVSTIPLDGRTWHCTHQRQLWVHAGVNAAVLSKRVTARTSSAATSASDHGAVFAMEYWRRHEHIRRQHARWYCDEMATHQ